MSLVLLLLFLISQFLRLLGGTTSVPITAALASSFLALLGTIAVFRLRPTPLVVPPSAIYFLSPVPMRLEWHSLAK